MGNGICLNAHNRRHTLNLIQMKRINIVAIIVASKYVRFNERQFLPQKRE